MWTHKNRNLVEVHGGRNEVIVGNIKSSQYRGATSPTLVHRGWGKSPSVICHVKICVHIF